MSAPLCPVTLKPATRHIQWVKSKLLKRLWRFGFGVDPSRSFGGVTRFGLWQSPTGLHFFDPPVEGDQDFYRSFHARLIERGLWNVDNTRHEFEVAATRIADGNRVLDVGAGFGSFRHMIPQAIYVGLDPNMAGNSSVTGFVGETLREHVMHRHDYYDVVCAFQVIEHVKDPRTFFTYMLCAARPGGLIFVGVPHVPSAFTRIPNYVINAPPNHLTWWTKEALQELCVQSGAVIESIENVEWVRADALLYWIERCSLIRPATAYFRDVLSWHAAALIGLVAGRALHAIRKVPKTVDEGAGLLLIARRPQTETPFQSLPAPDSA